MFHLQTLELVHWDYCQRVALPLDASIITIAGPNGSGKTTLLDAMRTLLGCAARPPATTAPTHATRARKRPGCEQWWTTARRDARPPAGPSHAGCCMPTRSRSPAASTRTAATGSGATACSTATCPSSSCAMRPRRISASWAWKPGAACSARPACPRRSPACCRSSRARPTGCANSARASCCGWCSTCSATSRCWMPTTRRASTSSSSRARWCRPSVSSTTAARSCPNCRTASPATRPGSSSWPSASAWAPRSCRCSAGTASVKAW
nr:ATP-binding protein [Paracidovorax cattleyae]